MRWRKAKQSRNIEDRRGGGGGRRPVRQAGGLSVTGIIIALAAAYFLGINPMTLLGEGGFEQSAPRQSQTPYQGSAAEEEMKSFVAAVLGDTETTWNHIYRQNNANYEEPKLVLFSGQVRSACGQASSASGPFYCPGDRKVYLDMTFFAELSRRFGAPGDFAQAYVIAHEVGHHVQTLMGISRQVQEAKSRASEVEANAIQVRMELQADCFAGLWARDASKSRKLVERGDIDEALRAANAIGDDMLQRKAQGHVVPDAFTHGTSEQRKRWFSVGFDTGSIDKCNTFEARKL